MYSFEAEHARMWLRIKQPSCPGIQGVQYMKYYSAHPHSIGPHLDLRSMQHSFPMLSKTWDAFVALWKQRQQGHQTPGHQHLREQPCAIQTPHLQPGQRPPRTPATPLGFGAGGQGRPGQHQSTSGGFNVPSQPPELRRHDIYRQQQQHKQVVQQNELQIKDDKGMYHAFCHEVQLTGFRPCGYHIRSSLCDPHHQGECPACVAAKQHLSNIISSQRCRDNGEVASTSHLKCNRKYQPHAQLAETATHLSDKLRESNKETKRLKKTITKKEEQVNLLRKQLAEYNSSDDDGLVNLVKEAVSNGKMTACTIE